MVDDSELLPTGTLAISRSSSDTDWSVLPLELRVVAGPDLGKVFSASRDRIVVGVHETADLTLSDRTVSRFHCELSLSDNRILLTDLGSRNGTFVGGIGILSAHIPPGSRIVVGSSELEVGLGAVPVSLGLTRESSFGGLVGVSVPMRAAFALLEKAAASDATLLLTGETGTGKESAAESVHLRSKRREAPFVIVDCSAVPENLIESELFGHEKGAFTGAHQLHKGAFEAAHGGTVFLDEIGELPLELQPKLLRALEKRHVKRVGSTVYSPVDVRVIAATNRNLKAEVNAQRFRSDLYYRLAVLEVRLPSLRERPDDLPQLVENLLEQLGASAHPEAHRLRSVDCRELLTRHPWPGNVRELRNWVERALALGDFRVDEPTPPGDATAAVADGYANTRRSALRSFERRYLEELLAQHAGNVSAAARTAGVDRKYLYRLLYRNGLR